MIFLFFSWVMAVGSSRSSSRVYLEMLEYKYIFNYTYSMLDLPPPQDAIVANEGIQGFAIKHVIMMVVIHRGIYIPHRIHE